MEVGPSKASNIREPDRGKPVCGARLLTAQALFCTTCWRRKRRSRCWRLPISRCEYQWSSCGQYDFGMEQCTGNPGGDCNQFPLPGENFHLPRLRKFGQVDGASAANQCRCLLVGGYARELWQQQAGMNKYFLIRPRLDGSAQFLQR